MRQSHTPIRGSETRRAPERAEGGPSNGVATTFHAGAGFRTVASRNLHRARDRATSGGPIRMSSLLTFGIAGDGISLRPFNTRQGGLKIGGRSVRILSTTRGGCPYHPMRGVTGLGSTVPNKVDTMRHMNELATEYNSATHGLTHIGDHSPPHDPIPRPCPIRR